MHAGLALLHVAEAEAMLGRAATCDRALDAARARLGTAADGVGEVEIDRMAGSCHLFLGRPERAEKILLPVSPALNAKQKSQAIVLGNLSLAVDPPGTASDIPRFVGADKAARRLAELPLWQGASVVKSNPDRAQLPVRELALRDGKLLYMAVPRIASLRPFYLLDPAEVDSRAAMSRYAAEVAPMVGPARMRPVDVVVCGTVAVDRRGVRIGKGAGFSDIEMGLLADANLLGPHTTIVTTVHQFQVVEEELPETAHDFRVDVIVTPDEVIECPPAPRPPGIIWEHLGAAKIAAIPVLAELQAMNR